MTPVFLLINHFSETAMYNRDDRSIHHTRSEIQHPFPRICTFRELQKLINFFTDI